MTIQGVNSSQSLQFQGDLQDTNSKLRRLVQDLVQVETQLNALIAIANQTTPDGPTIAKHVIATTAGLGEFHTTSGLTVGQVLKAISATNAAFDKIKFSDLVDSNISDDPEDGQIIQFVDGFWQAEDVTAIGASSGNNLGVGQGVYVNNTGAVLNFKTLLSLGGIALDIAADTIAVRLGAVPDDTVLGNVSGGTAIPVPLSQTQLRALIGTVDATAAGLAPPSIVVTGQILSDGGWIAPPAGGSITVGDGTTTLTGITDIEFTGATVSSGGAGIASVAVTGGGGGGPVGSIPDLVAWFEADLVNATPGLAAPKLYSSYGGGVLAHVDNSSNIVRADGTQTLNGRKVIRWPVSANGGLPLDTTFPLINGCTIFYVVQPNNTIDGTLIGAVANGITLYLHAGGVAQMQAAKTGVAAIGSSGVTWTSGAWFQGNFTYDPVTGNFAFRQSGAAGTTGASGIFAAGTGPTSFIGSEVSNSGTPLNDTALAELIVVDRVCTSGEILSVEADLLAKWGV